MNVVVLAGGISTERDVSLVTGANVVCALRRMGYNAQILDVYLGCTEDEAIHFFDRQPDKNSLSSAIHDTKPDIEQIKLLRNSNGDGFFGPNVLDICKHSDFVFIALHGQEGENGKIQATFDLLGIKYTGSGHAGSAIAMNKYISKQIMQANGILTADYYVINPLDPMPTYHSPCVIKPFSGGSSIGVSIAKSEFEFRSAIENARKYESSILIENYVMGREFSVGVLDGAPLPPIEICPKDGFYDYANKYQSGRTIETCPANLSDERTSELLRLSVRVFEALCLSVYGRIDFILSEDSNEFVCLEANSLPGLTPMSLLPQEAFAVGIEYDCLCDRILTTSEKKYDDYNRSIENYT